jgi:hypothetical protein
MLTTLFGHENKQRDLVFPSINKYFLRHHYYFYSMKGLNRVSSICMGWSFGETIIGWDNMEDVKL